MGLVDWVEDNIVEPVVETATDAYDAAEGFVDDLGDAGQDLLDDLVGGAESLAGSFGDALEDFGDWLAGGAEDVAEWAEDVWEDAKDLARDAAEAVEGAVEALAETVADALGTLATVIVQGVTDLVAALDSAVDWIVDHVTDAIEWLVDEALPTLWAALKLCAAVVMLIVSLPILLAAMIVCNLVTAEYGREYGSVVEALVSGSQRVRDAANALTLPAAGRYFVVSDLHMYSAGELDTPEQQDTKRLYRAVLHYYSAKQYTLVENGDIEDYWLRGGSGYGVAYDLAAGMPAPFFDGPIRDSALLGAAQVHLLNVVANNSATYGLVATAFHQRGAYARVVGNHDDVNARPEMIQLLGLVYPGIRPADCIVLDHGGRGIGVVAHGHQTDPWNQPACSFLGKVTTSLASAVRDLAPSSWRVLLASQADTEEIFDDDLTVNEMTDIDSVIGVDIGSLNSLDETVLYEAFNRSFGSGSRAAGLTGGPILVLGHTHALRVGPGDPESYEQWDRYYNDGCGIYRGAITGIEWDGTADPTNPQVRLVGWRYHPSAPDVALERVELQRKTGAWASQGDTRMVATSRTRVPVAAV